MKRLKVKRKLKIRKNNIIILVIVFLVILSFLGIGSTYGLFESSKLETFQTDIAKWNINVNNINVTENTSFVVDKITLENNTSVKEGKVAPGTSGYFDILIDGLNTDVSFKYDILFDFSNMDISNLKIVNIEEVNYGKLVRTDVNTYTNVITLNDIKNGKKNLVRVYVKWENSDESNDEDSAVGLNSEYNLNIPIKITFTQYLGEEIIEYIE